MCATDTVAALTIVKEKKFPTLNSILFGEGVVNDAVSILLFRAVEALIQNDRGKETGFTYKDLGFMLMHFAVLSLFSIAIGLFFGLLCAFVFKNLKGLHKQPVREIFLLMLFAYVSYITSEICGFSGVITLFCCGFTMSYYAY